MGPYRIIYADPPWNYNDKRKGNGGASDHYITTKTEDLAKMDVASLSAKDSVMFMWATWPCLKDAFALFDAWGFKYTTCGFNWIKTNKKSDGFFVGLGHHTRGNSEICLIGKRGKGVPRIDKTIRQLQIHRRGEHSAKPEQIREQIEQLYGINESHTEQFPRLEMFARQAAPGWDVFGNEAPDSIQMPLKEDVKC